MLSSLPACKLPRKSPPSPSPSSYDQDFVAQIWSGFCRTNMIRIYFAMGPGSLLSSPPSTLNCQQGFDQVWCQLVCFAHFKASQIKVAVSMLLPACSLPLSVCLDKAAFSTVLSTLLWLWLFYKSLQFVSFPSFCAYESHHLLTSYHATPMFTFCLFSQYNATVHFITVPLQCRTVSKKFICWTNPKDNSSTPIQDP